MSIFAERIKKIRKDLSLTQEKLSEKLKISIDTIQKWEKGTLTPQISVAEHIAQELNTSLSYLLGISENEDKNENENSSNMLFFKNGNQEVRIPNTSEENQKLFLTIIEKMITSSSNQPKINMQDNITGNYNIKM